MAAVELWDIHLGVQRNPVTWVWMIQWCSFPLAEWWNRCALGMCRPRTGSGERRAGVGGHLLHREGREFWHWRVAWNYPLILTVGLQKSSLLRNALIRDWLKKIIKHKYLSNGTEFPADLFCLYNVSESYKIRNTYELIVALGVFPSYFRI